MKNTYFGAAAILLFALLALNFKGSNAVQYGTADTPDFEGAMAFEYGPGLDAARPYKSFTLDTFANATTETQNVPFSFASRYTGSIHVTLTTLSGTRAMKIFLDETNDLTGATGWAAIDSVAPSAAVGNEYVIQRPEVYGRKQRIRVKGTAGATQSVAYKTTVAYKRRND